VKTLLSRFAALFRHRHIDRDLDDELETHIAMLTEENVRNGMTREEARDAARRSFGGIEQIKEAYRDRRTLPAIETVLKDLRYAARMLRRSPGFTAVAVLSLALGIGANTAIFTLINAVMLRTLPVETPSELVVLEPRFRGTDKAFISFPMYRDLRTRQQVFTDIFASAGSTPTRVTVQPGANPVTIDNVRTGFVSANYWNVLRIRPAAGRFFTADEDSNPARSETLGSVVVLSYAFWERQFGRNPAVLDTTIAIGRSPSRIIGVTPRGFSSEVVDDAPDMWVPLTSFSSRAELEDRHFNSWGYMARLKSGISRERATAAMTLLFQQLLADERTQERRAGSTNAQDDTLVLEPGATGLSYYLRRKFGKPLWIVMAVVGIVLLIACANVANLLLARATRRQREIVVRLALGCSRRRLIRQLLTESVLLSAIGAAVGLVFASWGSRALLRLVDVGPSVLPIDLVPDSRVLVFTIAVVLLSGIGFGIAPAVRASRGELRAAAARHRNRLSRTLVAAQVALSLLLLIGAGLLVRSLSNLHNIDLGFRPEHVLIFDLAHNASKRDPASLANVAEQAYHRVNRVAGVHSASFSAVLIFSPSQDVSSAVHLEGYPPGENARLRFNSVSPRYFETVGMTLLAGRPIEDSDTAGSPFVTVINESAERRYFVHGASLGKIIETTRPPYKGFRFQVIGVVRDAKYNDVRAETQPMFYLPLTQLTRSLRSLEVRTTQPASSIAGPVRQALLEVSKDIMIRRVITLTEHVDRTLSSERMIATLCSFFGVLALILASIGLYGVMSYAVAQRTSEIGIRMALGASARRVLRMVLQQSLLVVGIGAVAGIALAQASTRLLANFLYGLAPTDPITIASATFLLLAVALLAAWLPARRATRVDPMTALRYE
jgi:predicted permease